MTKIFNQSLFDLPQGAKATVVGLHINEDNTQNHELLLRLLEIGFIEGEEVTVIAHSRFVAQPVAVRIGGATFALRAFEAQCILVNSFQKDGEYAS